MFSTQPSEAAVDFSRFLAESRGISFVEAERLIERWVREYEPHTRPPPRSTHAAPSYDA
jgi:hypothetical protein